MLLGQAFSAISYQIRFTILFNLIKFARKAKPLLKVKATLLQKHNGNLFGKKFRTHIIEREKSKKKTMEVFKTTASPSKSKKRFSKGPPSYLPKKCITRGIPLRTKKVR